MSFNDWYLDMVVEVCTCCSCSRSPFSTDEILRPTFLYGLLVSFIISRRSVCRDFHAPPARNPAVRYQVSTGGETGDGRLSTGLRWSVLFQISTQCPRRGVSMSCSLAFALTSEISGFHMSAVLKSDLLTRWLTLIWNRDLWDCWRCSALIPHPHSMTHLDNRGCKCENLNSRG